MLDDCSPWWHSLQPAERRHAPWHAYHLSTHAISCPKRTKAIYAETLRMPGVSRQITGPQRLVLRDAKLNHAFQVLVSGLRTETTVTDLDHELAILATVREMRSTYPWGAT